MSNVGKEEAREEARRRDGDRDGDGDRQRQDAGTGTGAPAGIVHEALGDPQSPDAIRQLEDAFGTRRDRRRLEADYDDVVEQSFPASDPPPPP